MTQHRTENLLPGTPIADLIFPRSSENREGDMSERRGSRFNIVSCDQTGDRTEEREKPPARTLDDITRATLLSSLPKEKPVDVQVVMRDNEAHRFGREVSEFLLSEHYDVTLQQVQFQMPPVGQTIELGGRPGGGTRMIIGSRE